jgi:hypothetical protein
MSGKDDRPEQSGSCHWVSDEESRRLVAQAIAGVLAEAGVQELRVSDSRACQSWTVRARETDLPACIMGLGVGSTISGDGFALLVDADAIRWAARGAIARELALATDISRR